ncbi:MAG: helix-turn-helix transcriptional regulator [Desulfovermiculus sp.]|nr:helix-turn-helix transcriptional regulator [Desulfovermiculus sp.]
MLLIPRLKEHSLKTVLRSKGVHQAQVAQALGISLSSLSHYLNGYRQAPPEIAQKLEEIEQQISTGEKSC